MARAIKFASAAAVFAAAACGLIALATETTVSDVRTPTEPQIAPVQAAARADEPAPAAPGRPLAPATVKAPAQQKRDAFQNWSSSVAVLPVDLGQMGPSLKLGLDEARNNDMAFCFRELESDDAGVARTTSTRATDFVLYLEARDGAVDVVDAKVARPGTLPSSVLECCRDVLRGLEVKTFFTVPGARFSYMYEVEA